MMKNANIYILVAVLVCIAAYGGFIYGGNERQKTLDRNFELLNFSTWATEIKINVQLLDLIEAKKYKETENLLDKSLDVRLASISLYDKYAADYPEKDIFLAIDIAKKHREKYPFHEVNPHVESGVERAFKITERK
jgi:hypothetical protein